MKRSSLIPALFCICLLASCLDDPDCVTTTTDFVNVRFYNLEDNLTDTLYLDRLTALGSDSVLNDMDTVTFVRLPLDPQQDQATYYFESQYGRDTLVLSYTIGARMISEDCGVELLFTQVGTAAHSFDSVQILNSVPVEEVIEDIQVFN